MNEIARNEWYKCVMEQNEALNAYFEVYKKETDKQSPVIKAAKKLYDLQTAQINQRLQALKATGATIAA
jgi:hypothetical protein